MPKLIYTSNGEPYYVPDDELTAGNPLYPTTYPNNEGVTYGDTPKTSLPVAMPDDISDLPTFPVKQDLPQPKDRRTKEEKLAEMFGVVPGPEGPLGIVQSIESGLTAPGDVVKGNVEQQDVLGRAIDTAGLGVTGPLAMKPGTATLGSGMTKMPKLTPVEGNPFATKPYGKLKSDYEIPSGDYVYHATNTERADEIAASGKIKTYKAHEFTDQNMWPDGSVEKRNYFSNSNPWQFAPVEGSPTLLRVKKSDHPFKKESTGDIYSTKPIPASKIEYLSEDGSWQPLLKSDASNVGKVVAAQIKDLQAQIIAAKKTGKDITGIRNQIKELQDQLPKPIGIGHNNPPGPVPNEQGFYSVLENSLNTSKLKEGTAEQWRNELKRYGTTNEELQYGLGELPNGVISREQAQQAVKDNAVQLGEHWKTSRDTGQTMRDPDGTIIPTTIETKYSQYQMPGGSNYREVLLTLPANRAQVKYEIVPNKDGVNFDVIRNIDGIKEDYLRAVPRKEAEDAAWYGNEHDTSKNRYSSNTYTSSHWDEPNVIVHARMNDRIVDGKKSLHIEEIQSDWHQAGRKSGYAKELSPELKAEEAALKHEKETITNEFGGISGLLKAASEKNERAIEVRARREVIHKRMQEIAGIRGEMLTANQGQKIAVPDAPFKNTWDELALKKLIRHAVENGYDAISWTPGRAQSTNPSKHIEGIDYLKNDDGSYAIIAKPKNGEQIIKDTLSEKELFDLVGKDIGEKIVKGEGNQSPASAYKMLENTDLEIGGTKEFYDKILIDKANKLVKKFGSKVETKHLPLNEKEIKKLREITLPDEIALAKHKDTWDKLVKERQRLMPLVNDLDRKLSPKEWEKAKQDLKAVNDRMDHVHQEGVDETVSRMKGQGIPYLPLTPALKEATLSRGFPLFSAGVPVLSGVSHNPFVRITPVDGDPFAEDNSK